MISEKTIAVVVPAYNEETQIENVVKNMPEFVDRIVVVNDGSTDKTLDVLKQLIVQPENNAVTIKNKLDQIQELKNFNRAEQVLIDKRKKELGYFPASNIVNENPENSRIIVINLKKNSGVGAAVSRGYKWCLDHGIDCIAKMDGDGQMDPAELKEICMPIINEEVDYVKGNRLIHQSAWYVIPRIRFLGNSILSIFTKIASGYWHVSDTQTAFSAISYKALESIPLYKIYKTYGYPNDVLVRLNISFCSIKEVKVKPIYQVGENSKMKIGKIIIPILWLLIKGFIKRIWIKYLFKDFHPLFILYHFSFLLLGLAIPYAIQIIENFSIKGVKTSNDVLLVFMFLFISGFQSILFAMWMDIQDNNRLYKT